MFEEEYQLEFFKEKGYTRKVCKKCETGFWTPDDSIELCNDTPCVEYAFIGNSPFNKKYSIDDVRSLYIKFFEERGHTKFEKYPVIARWRDDVFLTGASIFDFQPFVTSGLVDPPANPLVVSQPCIRLVDIDSVGKTGKHMTSFEMMGHHSFNSPKKEVYWKEETVRYCHELLMDIFGVEESKIIYKEKPWFGGGNAGPSLEVQVSGLELATLVFMNMKKDPKGVVKLDGDGYSPMELRVVDTGYGLERFTWISQGTPTIYEAIYPGIIRELFKTANIAHELEDERYASIMAEHAKLAGIMDIGTTSKLKELREACVKRLNEKGFELSVKQLNDMIEPVERVYTIADHTHTLAFMLSDGIVPSNSKAGYLARLIFRRTLRLLDELNIDLTLRELVMKQIKTFDNIINQDLNDVVEKILDLETERYKETMEKGQRLVKRFITDNKEEKIPLEKLIEFYDTYGIHPRTVQNIGMEMNIDVEVPDAFNSIIAKMHQSPEEEEVKVKVSYDLPVSKPLYYETQYLKECEAVVLHSEDGMVILNQTVFYPEGGGQPGDVGYIYTAYETFRVDHVEKVGNVIVHRINGKIPKGEMVKCSLDWERRLSLMRHHTATHLVLGSARRVLGDQTWQTGAQKGEEESRVDITHYTRISEEEMKQIELLANEIVLENIPVEKRFVNRIEAERKYGLRLYQGGVPPGKEIRVVKIGNFDVEACAGTHLNQTSEIGLIKILKTERIQDGVERLTFAAGLAAVKSTQKKDAIVNEASGILRVMPEQLPKTVDRFFEEWKSQKKQIEKLRKMGTTRALHVPSTISEKIADIKVMTQTTKDADEDAFNDLIMFGRKINNEMERSIGIFGSDFQGGKIIIAKSGDVDINCSDIVKKVAEALGGGGGGKPEFALGGWKDSSKLEEAVELAKKEIKRILRP